MATRLIDAEFQFYGTKADSEQALQWPRYDCPDPDGAGEMASDKVPPAAKLTKIRACLIASTESPGARAMTQCRRDQNHPLFNRL